MKLSVAGKRKINMSENDMYYDAIFISHKPDGVSWASAGMGKGALGPQNVVKCFVLQMFSKLSLSGRSIDALF